MSWLCTLGPLEPLLNFASQALTFGYNLEVRALQDDEYCHACTSGAASGSCDPPIFLEHLEEKDQFGRHEPHSGPFGPHHYLCTMNPHVWRVDVFSALEDVEGQGFELSAPVHHAAMLTRQTLNGRHFFSPSIA